MWLPKGQPADDKFHCSGNRTDAELSAPPSGSDPGMFYADHRCQCTRCTGAASLTSYTWRISCVADMVISTRLFSSCDVVIQFDEPIADSMGQRVDVDVHV